MSEESKFFYLELKRSPTNPIFRFGFHERYENILQGGHQVVSESRNLTFIWRENMDHPEFRRTYKCRFKWTIGNIVSHMYNLIDEYLEFHNEDNEYFVDRSISGFSYDPKNGEIRIEDQS